MSSKISKWIRRATVVAALGGSAIFAQRADVRTIASALNTIDASGSYVVSAPLFAGAGGDGITVTASSVTIDLNGQEILCPGGLRGVGIRINGAQNVMIRNGHITNCAMAVIVNNSANVRLEGLVIRGTAIAVSAPPPEIGVMIVQSKNVAVVNNMLYNVGLGIFVRGGRSFGNRIEGNTLTAMTNGALGICYNPTDTDTAGPQGDLVKGNVIRGYPTAIALNKLSNNNVIQGNTLFYTAMAVSTESTTNLDMDNVKVLVK